jgi:hypothetical protein
VLTAIAAGTAELLGVGVTRVHEWVVMTDELLYAKLATAIGQSGSPLPTLHGVHVGFLGVVYPILLAPFYGSLDPPSAFTAAYVLNAVLMASAAAPAYLLARRVLARPWALAAALLRCLFPAAVHCTASRPERPPQARADRRSPASPVPAANVSANLPRRLRRPHAASAVRAAHPLH